MYHENISRKYFNTKLNVNTTLTAESGSILYLLFSDVNNGPELLRPSRLLRVSANVLMEFIV